MLHNYVIIWRVHVTYISCVMTSSCQLRLFCLFWLHHMIQTSMHNVSTLKHNHMVAILKKHLSPKLITITVTSSRMQTVTWVSAHALTKPTSDDTHFFPSLLSIRMLHNDMVISLPVPSPESLLICQVAGGYLQPWTADCLKSEGNSFPYQLQCCWHLFCVDTWWADPCSVIVTVILPVTGWTKG